MSDKEVIKVDCGCGCSCGNAFNLEIWLEDWDEYCFISSQASVFYLKQTSFFQVWKARFKAAWAMLCGKEYCLHEICLNKEQYNNLINKMLEFKEKTNATSISV